MFESSELNHRENICRHTRKIQAQPECVRPLRTVNHCQTMRKHGGNIWHGDAVEKEHHSKSSIYYQYLALFLH